MNRLRCLLLLVVLFNGFLAKAQYDSDFTVGDFSYVITSSNTVKLVKAKNQKGDITIPTEVDYKNYHFTVTTLGNLSYSGQDIESVIVPSSITEIGSAFSGCKKLRKVVLPSNLTTIWFSGCTSLEDITLPLSVSEIQESAFKDCTSLTRLTLHEGIEIIGDDAFRNSGLKEVRFPKSLRAIGKRAFMESKVEGVTIDGNINRLPDEVFNGCEYLKKVTILEGAVKSLGEVVFADCVSLKSVDIGEGVSSFGSFNFSGCTALTYVSLPSSLREIGAGTFNNCVSLQRIDIPYGISSIGNLAFRGCSKLKRISLPATVNTIDMNAFQDCVLLEDVVFNGEILNIKDYAFQGCKALKKLECLMDTVTTLGGPYDYICFEDIVFSQTKLLVRERLLEQYKANKYWGNFKNIEILPDNPVTRAIPLSIQGEGRVSFKDKDYSYGAAMLQFNKGEEALLRIVPGEYQKCAIILINKDRAGQLLYEGLEGEIDISNLPMLSSINIKFLPADGIITIKQVEEGCIHLMTELDHDYLLGVKTADGWRVHSVSMDGDDVTDAFRYGSFNLRLLHDVTFVVALEEGTSDISQIVNDNNLRVIVDGNSIHLYHLEKDEIINIYTVGGQLVKQIKAINNNMTVQLPQNIVYVIRTKNKTIKVLL